MMLKLRENLQGTLAVVLIVVVVVIMVVSGQEMLKSSVSDRVASVNGVDISGRDLSRAMMNTRARMQEQMQLDENAEQLKDENLRQPALNSLLREKALLLAAQKAGMGVSDAVIKDQIKQSFTQDKQFNAQIFNGYLSRYGYTQASLIEHESGSYLLRQLVTGLTDSAFVTASDLELLASIAGQKRTYSTITIPKEKVASKSSESVFATDSKDSPAPSLAFMLAMRFSTSDFSVLASIKIWAMTYSGVATKFFCSASKAAWICSMVGCWDFANSSTDSATY